MLFLYIYIYIYIYIYQQQNYIHTYVKDTRTKEARVLTHITKQVTTTMQLLLDRLIVVQ